MGNVHLENLGLKNKAKQSDWKVPMKIGFLGVLLESFEGFPFSSSARAAW